MAQRVLQYVLFAQGAYYLITAIWPMVSLKSFMRFVGPKPDRFIFWTVDLLIVSIGIAVLFGAVTGDLRVATILGIASTISFMTVEVVFAGRISPWFWADFAAEALIFIGLVGSVVAQAWGS